MCSDLGRGVAALVLAYISLAACTVKEDRELCPRHYVMAFGTQDLPAGTMLRWRLDSDGYSESGDFTGDAPPDTIDRAVPRGPLVCRVASVAAAQEEGLSIPVGEECPEVYSWRSLKEISAEEEIDTVRLHRQAAVVNIRLKNVSEEMSRAAVIGDVSGFDRDFEPVEGLFRRSIGFDGRGLASVRVPRQKDSSLRLDISYGGGSLRSFAIGNYIALSGYNWQDLDLEDIFLEIDWRTSRLTMTNSCWVASYTFQLSM